MSFEEFRAVIPTRLVRPGEAVRTTAEVEGFDAIRRRFGDAARTGDLIYYYCSEPADWDRLMGAEGYVLVRDGVIVEDRVRRMN